MDYKILIPEALDGLTIKELLEDAFLVPRKIRHFLRVKKHVFLNQEPVTWQTCVSKGDELMLIFDEEDYPPVELLYGDARQVEVLYEDQHIIVVNKPEGMKTHGNEPTEIALLNHVSAYVGEPCFVVHRLDKETSGALLFAKNPFVLPIVNRLLETRKISRQYWALVEGLFPKDEQIYRQSIGRDRHDRRKRRVDIRQGQAAQTRVRCVKWYAKTSLVNCQLATGRTHQIRVHLSYHHYGIVGDPLYGAVGAGRMMLHAHSLTFIHPFTLDEIRVKAPSQTFEAVLKSQEKIG